MKVRMFETLQPDTEVREQMTYAAGSDLLVTFFSHHTNDPGDYGYDLYDFDDLVFQTARDYSSLEDAKSAAIVAAATLEA